MPSDSLADLLAPFRASRPPKHELFVRLADETFRVRCDHAALLHELRDYLAVFIVAPESSATLTIDVHDAPFPLRDLAFEAVAPGAGKSRVKDEVCDFADARLLRKRATGMHFAFGSDLAIAIGAARENLNQVVNFINNRFMQRMLQRDYRLCHAAGVALKGHGLALAGVSGAGKSTLALRLLKPGAEFVSNDRLLIRRDADVRGYEMVGVAKHPRVNPGTILHNTHLAPLLSDAERQRLVALPAGKLRTLEEKYDARIDQLFPMSPFRLTAPVRAAFLLTWRPTDAKPTFAPVKLAQRDDLLQTLIKPLGQHYYASPHDAWAHADLEDYRALLADLPAYEIGGGIDFDFAVREIHAVVADLPSSRASATALPS